jgi:cell division protein FtsB
MAERSLARKAKSKKRKTFFKFFTLMGLVLLVFVSVALGKEVYRRHQISQEIDEAKQEVESLEKKNFELQALIDYLNTDSFKEIQARQNLGLQKEGEMAVAIEPGIASAAENQGSTFESAGEVKEVSNFKKWWKYFFAAK